VRTFSLARVTGVPIFSSEGQRLGVKSFLKMRHILRQCLRARPGTTGAAQSGFSVDVWN